MAYQRIHLDSDTPPRVLNFIERKLDRHFLVPARELFKCPRASSAIDANFGATIANILVDVISGVSALALGTGGQNSGLKYREILRRCFPWDQEPGKPPVEECIDILYETFRNPLAHALGVGKDGKEVKIIAAYGRNSDGSRRGLRESEIVKIERLTIREPTWPATVTKAGQGAKLSLVGLYWGVRAMISRATCEKELMEKADAQLEAWRHW